MLAGTEDGWRLRGLVMIPIDDEPAEIHYEVTTDARWHTRDASVRVGEKTIEVSVNEGEWTVNGVIDHHLDGCVDIDLGWTPSTNTLPTRRVDPVVGNTVKTRAAWLRFPEMTFTASSQTYARISDDLWRYQSEDADYEFITSHEGVVCRYGELWWGSVELVATG